MNLQPSILKINIILYLLLYFVNYLLFLHTEKYKNMPDLKDEIVNKSFFQFLNRGYKACSLKDLEKATGLTKGAFYYYFRNKEEILKAGIEKYLSVVSEISEEEFLKVGSLKAYIDIVVARKERRAEQLQQMFDFFIIDIAFFQLVLEVAPLFPEYQVNG